MEEPVLGDKHQIILDAAQKRFARFGLAKVTMDEIAQDLGMAKASLYYYFSTKESMFKAVISREQNSFITSMNDSLRQEWTAEKKLEYFIENRLVYLRELISLGIPNANSFYQMKPLFSDLYEKFFHDELSIVMQILVAGRNSGEFHIPDLEKTAEMILHILRGLRFYYLQTKDFQQFEMKDHEQLVQEMRMFTAILLNGIKNPATKSDLKGTIE